MISWKHFYEFRSQSRSGLRCPPFSNRTSPYPRRVKIEHSLGLDGHSDADVLLHALTDAVFGAAAMGDIGRHFPDTDQQYKGADSRVLLRRCVELVREKGWEIVNVDSTIIAQKPKLAPHMPAIVASVAQCLGIEEDRVNVKAKTNEKLGFEGKEEGIVAQAVVLLKRNA